MERRRYRNPPIEEAICEVRFAPNPEQDFAAPARFYELIKAAYPGKPVSQPLPPGELAIEQGSTGIKLGMRQEARVLFRDADGKKLVGLGSSLLSVHTVRPYTRWEEFRDRVAAAVDAYIRAAPPPGVKRIGVRYVNKIEIPATEFSFGAFFTAGAMLPEGLRVSTTAHFSRLESTYADRPIRLLATVASLETSNQSLTATMLDLEVMQEWSSDLLAVTETMSHIDEFRKREREAFESFITERAREKFDAR